MSDSDTEPGPPAKGPGAFGIPATPPVNLSLVADQDLGASLPDPVSFDSPPVSQVILGVEFSGPVISEANALADFWNSIRNEFPDVERRPLLAPMAEVFEPQPEGQEFEFVLEPQRSQRYMFRNESRSFVVQVQEDRFAFSWQQTDAEEYPRYRSIRERFQQIYKIFIEAADDVLLAENPPAWCATTYMNEIDHPESKDPMYGPLEDILRFVGRPESDVLPPVEDTTMRQRRLLRDEAGNPRGRLYIQAVPTFTSSPSLRPGYRITLRVVAMPSEPNESGVFACQDEGRDLIVRSFKDITTAKMHRVWGLREG